MLSVEEMEHPTSSLDARTPYVDTPSTSYHSTSLLIPIASPEHGSNPLPDDDDEERPYDDSNDTSRSSHPALPTSTAFLFLLAPYLKLGAMSLTNYNLPFEYSIASILVFALLSAFSQQLLYLLSVYLQKEGLEELILHTFATSGMKLWRKLLIIVYRTFAGVLRVLLVAVYFRHCLYTVSSLFSTRSFLPSRIVWSAIFAIIVIPLCYAPSIASKRIKYATWISVAAYVLWFVCVVYAHSQGGFSASLDKDSLGIFWHGITTVAFAFTSSTTLLLTTSLNEYIHLAPIRKSRFRSPEVVSATSVFLAMALLLPLPIIFRYPHKPMRLPHVPAILVLATLLNAVILLSTIPYVLITAPIIPFPSRAGMLESTRRTASKIILLLIAISLSHASNSTARVSSDLLLVMALSGTYFLPAILHITTHQFRRPRSIVLPPQARNSSILPSQDELLYRKELELQRRRNARRIVWDVGVWILLVPLGSGGFIWAAGSIAGYW